MKKSALITLLLLGLTGMFNLCSAIKVPGYIINQDQDTIYGTVVLSKVDHITGDLIIGGFDQASLYSSVYFKGSKDKSFHSYSPDMIRGYGFGYDTTTFTFRTFKVKFNSLFPEGQERTCFLNQIYQGRLELYQYITCLKDPSGTALKDGYKTYREYYLYTDTNILLRATSSERIKSVYELLQQAGVEKQFLDKIPDGYSFNDLKKILMDYDGWLAFPSQEEEK